MGRKVVKVMAVLQMILCFVAYFSMSYHFDHDPIVYGMLANTDFLATLLRLSLYIIPGIHLLSSLYGLVFDEKTMLILISIFEMAASGLSFTFVGKSEYMLILSIVSCVIALTYFVSVLSFKKTID